MSVGDDSSRLASFGRPARAFVVGASGGIGRALVADLAAASLEVRTASRSAGSDLRLDLTDEASIATACAALAEGPPLRLVVVASGVLQADGLRPEKSLRALDPAALAHSFAVNAAGPALVLKHVLPLMPRQGKSVFAALSARVGSISDNRLGGWYGYRAAKAALNQFMRTAAIEARRTHPEAVLVTLHPGTVATPLSAPFAGGAEAVAPAQAAANLMRVIDDLGAHDSGGFFAWDGAPIAF